MYGWSHRFLGITSTFLGENVPCSRTQHGLTRVGPEPPTSGSRVRGINHQATGLWKSDVVIDELNLLFDGVQDQDMIIGDKTSTISINQVKQSLNKIDEARQRFQKLCIQNGIFLKLLIIMISKSKHMKDILHCKHSMLWRREWFCLSDF